jgi:hypothetical protein
VKWATLRVLLALAVARRYSIFHLDVKTAFLHGHLKEEVYVTQPQGFEVEGREHLVCHLHKHYTDCARRPALGMSGSIPSYYFIVFNEDVAIQICTY